MRRMVPGLLMVFVGFTALVGCGGGGALPKNTARPLSQVSASAAVPKTTRPAGPVLTSACRELSRAEVASTLGVSSVSAQELPGGKSPDGGSGHACMYLTGKANHLDLFISTEPATRSAQLAVSIAIKQYTGTLQNVPGVGDAATFTGSAAPGPSPSSQILIAAQAEGSQVRMITISAFTKGDAKGKLVSLARDLLSRI